MYKRLKFAIYALLPLLVCIQSCSQDSGYVLLEGAAQGGAYQVKLRAAGASCSVEELRQGIDSILFAVDRSVSGYNPESLLSRFNAGERIVPDGIFSELYRLSREYWLLTDGAVDVAAGPLFDIWGFGFKNESMPSREAVDSVAARCGMALLPADLDSLIRFRPEGTVLNFNCIAQGYSSDLVAEWLASKGVEDMLVNVGGEICSRGVNPSGKAWAVGIDRPVDGNYSPGAMIQGVYRPSAEPCGIVTSGNYRKFYMADGRKYSHTVDPRTAGPVTHSLLSATIVAADATSADALATYCMVIGEKAAEQFISSAPGIEGCLIYDDGGVMKSWTSPGFVLEER